MSINSKQSSKWSHYIPVGSPSDNSDPRFPQIQDTQLALEDQLLNSSTPREFNLKPNPELGQHKQTTENSASTFSRALQYITSFIYRRRKIIQIMIISDIIILFVLHLWFTSLSNAFPLKDDNLTWSQTSKITRDSLAERRSALFDVINDKLNQDLFVQLEGLNHNYFFDLGSNTVGTASFPMFNQYQRQPYVSNGYIGSRIPNLGQGYTLDQQSDSSEATKDDLSNGWPLFNKRFAGAFIAGFYDIQKNTTGTNFPELLENGYESVIAAVPQWTSLSISTEKDGRQYELNPANSEHLESTIKNYSQTMSFSDGIVTTEFVWLDDIYVRYDIIAHREDTSLGLVNLQVANLGSEEISIDVKDELDFKTSSRCQLVDVGSDDDGIFIQFQPSLLDQVNAAIYSRLKVSTKPEQEDMKSSGTSVENTQTFQIKPNDNISVVKFAGIVSSDLDESKYSSANSTLEAAKSAAFKYSSGAKALSTHRLAWDKLYGSVLSVTVPDDRMITLASRASIYHMAANTRSDAKGVSAALGVGGLSSDSYGGMVFWDTDLWMMNGILPFFPDHAKSIINYRVHTHEQALQNVRDYRPDFNGAAYPWTSGRYGNCTATGPCFDYEYHINIAVARAAWEYYLSGAGDDKFLEETALPLIQDSAQFLSDYVEYNDTLKQFTTKNLTDPDEYANHVDNGAYTNAGISVNMKWAIAVAKHLNKEYPSSFDIIVGNMHLPEANNDQRATLEYTGMNSSAAIKQADVIMLTYPFENELISDEQAYTNMELYSLKQVSYGPAMTFPIFSIVASDLSERGCASQAYLRKSVQPFLRGPFAQFSEQNNDNFLTNGGTHPAFPFLTAHGGFIQAILHGLMGFRYDFEMVDEKISRILRLDPIALPCLPGGIQISGVKYMGHTLSLAINETSFTVKDLLSESGAPKTINLRIGKRNVKHGKYELQSGKSLTFPLFETQVSIPGSISECGSASFYNITEGSFGDVPLLINDGDNTTHWQANYNDSTAKILADFKKTRNLTGGYINWGDKPPTSCSLSSFNYNVPLSNVSSILGSVDFGTDVHERYKYSRVHDIVNQSDVFTQVLQTKVDVTAPFDPKEYASVEVPDRINLTQFRFPEAVQAQFLLIEVSGIHDTEPTDGSIGGAKLYEVVFYDK
ncbi:hypothetical protein PGUG_00531 [Meyerozyma guilliermondii ATCC 6260]|uniref:alpha,alpha-trehalase n=1 Tax=Meyerozyma guilliermondii (strain ATCC 6260 / CBS 566 / DSM 6381 / JCM 1539 / NBRC 10279 / NRRL Y-324) TaxID=294746 RepID=A5DB76_PICGU|nr:uncharacterized protein PGUG_00531 [Meyerozyma guilliermondii ATCC 6260]EDK36433.2 hypothetical protein PGUG_00531 [Meyerozyma guilliermondii ATCC 6260]